MSGSLKGIRLYKVGPKCRESLGVKYDCECYHAANASGALRCLGFTRIGERH